MLHNKTKQQRSNWQQKFRINLNFHVESRTAKIDILTKDETMLYESKEQIPCNSWWKVCKISLD